MFTPCHDVRMTTERVYTLVEAAAVAGVSTPTIRRRRAALLEAGATDDPKGWRIPHSALVAAGFTADWSAGEAAGDGEREAEPEEPAAEPEPEPDTTPEPPAEQPQVPPTTAPEPAVEESDADRLRDAQDRVRRLEAENMVLRHETDKWQMVARERLNALNAERVALHALSIYHEAPKQIEQAPAPDKPEPKRGWWSRMWD